MTSPKAKRERRKARRATAQQKVNRAANVVISQRVTRRREFPYPPQPSRIWTPAGDARPRPGHGAELRFYGLDDFEAIPEPAPERLRLEILFHDVQEG
jgi:hypothetical protein